ncbi:MAG: hypothetical protein Q8850_02480 [Candidatus Phytoplasma australasiaticum]|nr:hypothetical protein [Candidatus Phytoplasma australasiaticum]
MRFGAVQWLVGRWKWLIFWCSFCGLLMVKNGEEERRRKERKISPWGKALKWGKGRGPSTGDKGGGKSKGDDAWPPQTHAGLNIFFCFIIYDKINKYFERLLKLNSTEYLKIPKY